MTKRTFNDRPRVERGFYPTPREAFAPLADVWWPYGAIYEPCAGDGALIDHMEAAGWAVGGASDLAPKRSDIAEVDATALPYPNASISHFVTNPPWPLPHARGGPTKAIIEALSEQLPSWFLLPADWMHNVCNADLMRRCEAVVAVGRVKWIPDSPHAGFDNAAWYYFDWTGRESSLSFKDGSSRVDLTFVPR